MNDEKLVKRTVRLLMMLSGGNGYTKPEIAKKLDVSVRQVARYFEELKNAGLDILCNSQKRYSIDKSKPYNKSILEMMYFSDEEAYIVSKAIHSIDDNTLQKNDLIRKLTSLYNYGAETEIIVQRENSENVHRITQAIKQCKQVRLLNYKSGNRNTISHRIVEPFKITTGYQSFWAFDPAGDKIKNKLFKFTRIGEVEILETTAQHQPMHREGLIDVFRMSSHEKIHIEMELTLKAYNLLTEEYPLAEKFIQHKPTGEYAFKGWVTCHEGIGRFVLGLPNDIKVIKPKKFKEFLNKQIKIF